MSEPITLPLWQLLVLLLFAAWAAFERLLLPGARWFLRRSTNRMLEELHARLQIEIRPFQRTKREVLIDRLLYDPQVQRAAEAYSLQHDMPRELVMRRVERYVKETVPAFNAYVYFRPRLLAGPAARPDPIPGTYRLRRSGRRLSECRATLPWCS